MSVETVSERDLEPEIAAVAGVLNLANAELTRLAAEALDTEAWYGTSPAQWLVYCAGVSAARARTILSVAERRDRFPTLTARFDAGELSLEQMYELVQAPPEADAAIEEWGTIATPARIRRSIRVHYGHARPAPNADEPGPDPADDTTAHGADPEWVTAGIGDDRRWRIRGQFDADSGATIGAAMLHAREVLWTAGQTTISEADCLREVCERYLDGVDSPLRRDRSKVWVHLDAATGTAVSGTGVRLPDALADKICCDGIIQPVWERDGLPFSVGRARHIVPERTRRIILLRDQGCRVPGCNHDRIIEVHHIIHWTDGGPTDTWNLVALCAQHHRMHHQGRLGITGNADQPDGLVFTDQRGRRLQPCRAPTPPTQLPTADVSYCPPLKGRVDWNWVGLSWPTADAAT